MPVNWTDGVTLVNAANLEIMEADTAAKQAASEKGQANGYASLDGTGKVPLAQLPPVGADLVYNGDYAAGPTYEDGDIVVSNGIAYMCVVPTTTPPEVWPGGPTPQPPMPSIPYGTSLPASPTDGMEAILVDSVIAPSYQWRFRYNAQSSSANKWEFVGGRPAVVQSLPDESVTLDTSWRDFPTPLRITVPRAGDYVFTGMARMYNGLGGATTVTLGWDPLALPGSYQTVPQSAASYLDNRQAVAVGSAGQQISLRYNGSGGGLTGSVFFAQKIMEILPLRVS